MAVPELDPGTAIPIGTARRLTDRDHRNKAGDDEEGH
jgi:hypothetical protein